jgi:hypothetical protein
VLGSHVLSWLMGWRKCSSGKWLSRKIVQVHGITPLRLILRTGGKNRDKHTRTGCRDAARCAMGTWFFFLIKHLDRTKAHRKLAEHIYTHEYLDRDSRSHNNINNNMMLCTIVRIFVVQQTSRGQCDGRWRWRGAIRIGQGCRCCTRY